MTKKLRIAMFFSADPHAAGGLQEHVCNLATKLRQKGHTVVFFGSEHGANALYPNTAICKRVTAKNLSGNWGEYTLATKNTNKEIAQINASFDVLHIHSPYLPFVAWRLIGKVKIPIVTTFHTAWRKESHLALLEFILPMFRWFFSRHVRAAIFVSQVSLLRWQAVCNDNVKKKVILNAADVEHPCKIKKYKKNDTLNVLFLSRIVRSKGLLFLLKALLLLKKKWSKIHLTVVGTGQDIAFFQKFVADSGLSRVVSFTGEVTGKERMKFYRDADVFCAPYGDEGLSLALLEAMACGCPIVGFHNPSFDDVLAGYPAPELFSTYGDIQGLAHSFEHILSHPEVVQHASEWTQDRMQEFTWEKNVAETEEIYYQVVESVEKSPQTPDSR